MEFELPLLHRIRKSKAYTFSQNRTEKQIKVVVRKTNKQK